MRTLEIVFTKSKKHMPIGSWSIRWWTNKPYSHVARKLKIKEYIPAYYQASEGKVNYETESVFNKKHTIVKSYKLEVSNDIYNSISKACFEEAGKPYGLLQNIGIVLTDILKVFNIVIKNPWKQGRNCSELLYLNIIVPLLGNQGYDPDKIKPHQIEDIIISKCQKFLI